MADTTDQIHDLFSKSHNSNEKLDYFMCSVSGGLFAYIGQTFKPEELPKFSSLYTLLSLIVLAYSFFLGCKRIQTIAMITRINREVLTLEHLIAKKYDKLDEIKVKSAEAASMGKVYNVRNDMGVPYTNEMFLQDIEDHKLSLNAARQIQDEDMTAYRNFGIRRDDILKLGFTLIVCAKFYQWVIYILK
jgi:hypothetical protein